MSSFQQSHYCHYRKNKIGNCYISTGASFMGVHTQSKLSVEKTTITMYLKYKVVKGVETTEVYFPSQP